MWAFLSNLITAVIAPVKWVRVQVSERTSLHHIVTTVLWVEGVKENSHSVCGFLCLFQQKVWFNLTSYNGIRKDLRKEKGSSTCCVNHPHIEKNCLHIQLTSLVCLGIFIHSVLGCVERNMFVLDQPSQARLQSFPTYSLLPARPTVRLCLWRLDSGGTGL